VTFWEFASAHPGAALALALIVGLTVEGVAKAWGGKM
jgi:hypothetical protein